MLARPRAVDSYCGRHRGWWLGVASASAPACPDWRGKLGPVAFDSDALSLVTRKPEASTYADPDEVGVGRIRVLGSNLDRVSFTDALRRWRPDAP